MVPGVFGQRAGSPPTGKDDSSLPPFRIKGVIINYPLHHPLYQYRQDIGE